MYAMKDVIVPKQPYQILEEIYIYLNAILDTTSIKEVQILVEVMSRAVTECRIVMWPKVREDNLYLDLTLLERHRELDGLYQVDPSVTLDVRAPTRVEAVQMVRQLMMDLSVNFTPKDIIELVEFLMED